MEWLLRPVTEFALSEWEAALSGWFFGLSLALLAFELLRYGLKDRLSWPLIGDTVTNFLTQLLYLAFTVLYYTFFLSALAFFHQFSFFDIGVNWATVLICILLADLAYYWEHRFTHRVALAWATHTVHHSSPNFNLSVAYRFGPMDSVWPLFFLIPLVLLGFDPFVVLFAEVFVLLYQTFLHTELVGKLPRPIEAILNTPSHHRVHHGSNPEYMDKNYGGIFIVWDRLFGTFAEEKAPVVYGITEPVNSVNPLVVFFHGLARLWRDFWATTGLLNKLTLLIMPPGWRPAASRSGSA